MPLSVPRLCTTTSSATVLANAHEHAGELEAEVVELLEWTRTPYAAYCSATPLERSLQPDVPALAPPGPAGPHEAAQQARKHKPQPRFSGTGVCTSCHVWTQGD